MSTEDIKEKVPEEIETTPVPKTKGVKRAAKGESKAEKDKKEAKEDEKKAPLSEDASGDASSDAKKKKKGFKPVAKKGGEGSKPGKSAKAEDAKPKDKETGESPKKRARTAKSGKKKAKAEEEAEEEAEAEEFVPDEGSEDENEVVMEDDEEEDEDDFEEEEDPEDDDVKGKGYSHVVMFTHVGPDVRSKLVADVKSLKGYMTRDESDATHVVCDKPQRTIKLMAAILRGAWVLSSKWIEDSAAKGEWQPEEQYEVPDFAGARTSRLSRKDDGSHTHLFAGSSFVVAHTPQTRPTKSEMATLVKAGGGTLLFTKELHDADFYLECDSRPLPKNLPQSVTPIRQSDFFDAITLFKPLEKRPLQQQQPDAAKEEQKEEETKAE